MESVRSNLVPMIVLWSFALALVCAYFLLPGLSGTLEALAKRQALDGWLPAFANRFVFAGLVPGFFLLTVKSIRPPHPLAVALAQGVWCGVWGIVCNWFYELQAWAFGAGAGLATLALKTAVDQFVWTVLVIAPVNGAFFLWMGQDFSFARTRRVWPRRFFRDLVLPMLVPNWCLWIPVVFVVYAFPLPLQIQVSGLALSVSMLLSLRIGCLAGKEPSP